MTIKKWLVLPLLALGLSACGRVGPQAPVGMAPKTGAPSASSVGGRNMALNTLMAEVYSKMDQNRDNVVDSGEALALRQALDGVASVLGDWVKLIEVSEGRNVDVARIAAVHRPGGFGEAIVARWRQAARGEFQKSDLNRDGFVGPDEIISVSEKSTLVGWDEALVARFDLNRDGKLSPSEFEDHHCAGMVAQFGFFLGHKLQRPSA